MLPCPSCGRPLSRSPPGPAEHWACGHCGGRAYTLGRMREAFPAPFFDKAQAAVGAGGWRGIRRCPLCTMHLVGCRFEHGGSSWALDHCDRCRLVWLDRGEHEAARGLIPAPPPDPVLDGRMSSSTYSSGVPDGPSVEASERFPDQGAEDILAVLGLPVLESGPVWNRPWTTWLVAGAMVLAGLLEFALGAEAVVQDWGLDPSRPFRHGGLTFVSSFFLHGGLWHLVANAYVLLACGVGVENSLRPGRFLLLLALSALAGDLLYVALLWGSPGVTVGASGGISGVLVYWALAFPHARVRLFWLVWFRPFFYTFTARAALGLWVAVQVLGALLQLAGFHGANNLAHLGGGVAGFVLWYLGPDGPRPAPGKGDTIRLSSPIRWEE